jgi:hypothetical protein
MAAALVAAHSQSAVFAPMAAALVAAPSLDAALVDHTPLWLLQSLQLLWGLLPCLLHTIFLAVSATVTT